MRADGVNPRNETAVHLPTAAVADTRHRVIGGTGNQPWACTVVQSEERGHGCGAGRYRYAWQMRRRMLKSKIHRATVTAADLNYIGSISIDPVLLAAADILEHEQVTVLDVDNGARFETYAIVGAPGEICLNGAAARLVHVGDTVILLTYAEFEEHELAGHRPLVVHVDEKNVETVIA